MSISSTVNNVTILEPVTSYQQWEVYSRVHGQFQFLDAFNTEAEAIAFRNSL